MVQVEVVTANATVELHFDSQSLGHLIAESSVGER